MTIAMFIEGSTRLQEILDDLASSNHTTFWSLKLVVTKDYAIFLNGRKTSPKQRIKYAPYPQRGH